MRGSNMRAPSRSLEPFTRSQFVYRTSRVPRALFVLTRTGNRYVRRGIKGVAFDPVPMLTHEGLARDYEQTGHHELALEQYRRAIAVAPPNGLFARVYTRRARRLETKVQALKKAKAEAEESGKEKTPAPDNVEKEQPGDEQQENSPESGKQDANSDSSTSQKKVD